MVQCLSALVQMFWGHAKQSHLRIFARRGILWCMSKTLLVIMLSGLLFGNCAATRVENGVTERSYEYRGQAVSREDLQRADDAAYENDAPGTQPPAPTAPVYGAGDNELTPLQYYLLGVFSGAIIAGLTATSVVLAVLR